MYCEKCGKEVSVDAQFCRSCGAALGRPSPSACDVEAPRVTTRQGDPARVLRRRVLPVAAGLLLILVATGAYLMGTRSQSSQDLSAILATDETIIAPGKGADEVGGNQIGETDGDAATDGALQPTSSEEDLRSQCQSNLKQIALAVKQYTTDYDNRFPLVAVNPPPSPAAGVPYGWADALQPYLKSAQIYQCAKEGSTSRRGFPLENGYTDYYYNAKLNVTFDWAPGRIVGTNEAALSEAANTILGGEGTNGDARYARTDRETAGGADVRHLGGANYMFTDGHVKWLYPDAVKPASIPVSDKVYSHATR